MQYYLRARFHFNKDQFADLMVISGIAGTISQGPVFIDMKVSREQRLLSIGLFFECIHVRTFSSIANDTVMDPSSSTGPTHEAAVDLEETEAIRRSTCPTHEAAADLEETEAIRRSTRVKRQCFFTVSHGPSGCEALYLSKLDLVSRERLNDASQEFVPSPMLKVNFERHMTTGFTNQSNPAIDGSGMILLVMLIKEEGRGKR
ncbi:hypothetical protein K2173_009730 [Erythroxylum novogranatense]|uniref:Uncharacterized protein n=1 Tax=Erythroxylum novogranatense TaxID=1862640 RepID=A0AAV8U880_9ROSI|nr:hypothetical protein K2173_009730 [Erythroxylum novogranatense]